MQSVINATVKGIFRDRVFHGIILTAVLFLLIPAAASLSMRQVTELSITLTLSLISFILLLLSVFLGGASLWKDMEKRYTHSVLGLPITRGSYLLGKYVGIAVFLFLSALALSVVSLVIVGYCSGIYPADRPIVWSYVVLAMAFDFLKYLLLVAIAFLFSTFSTSFFLPIFSSISIYFVGSASQQVYDYINTPTGQKMPELLQIAARALYYVLPNFSSFDLKINAIYGIPINYTGAFLTFLYFLVYTGAVLSLATIIFSYREMK